jgi:hypothetical protein
MTLLPSKPSSVVCGYAVDAAEESFLKQRMTNEKAVAKIHAKPSTLLRNNSQSEPDACIAKEMSRQACLHDL